MKKSFFVGFLATLGFAEEWRPSYYKPAASTHGSVEKIEISEPSFPRVNVNALFPFSGTSASSYNAASDAAIQNAENNLNEHHNKQNMTTMKAMLKSRRSIRESSYVN